MNIYFVILQQGCFKDYVNFVMSFIIFVCKYSEHCTLLILDLCYTVLIESIYMYPNLFRSVKAKYVFYARFYKKTCPIHYNNVYITFVIVFYADCEYAILYKTQNLFLNLIKHVLWTNAVHLWSKSLWCHRARNEFFFLCSTSD